MKTLKFKRIFALIWVIILFSLLSSIYMIFNFKTYIDNAGNNIGLWISISRSLTSIILLVMSVVLWQITRSCINKNKWQPHFYNQIKTIGFWSLIVGFATPAFQTLIYYQQFMHNLSTFESQLDAVIYICTLIFANSALMWFFSLSIFLFAELLKIANQVKAENESFI